ncbi:permease [Haloplanus litoreus]|uniref:Permease n=1 Tax=Haloplanus litoreus TaxID=767515 RepID=A0ABD5ZUU4_9EURY
MSTDGMPDNVLFEWYGRYIGDPETETDVYLGFALFFGGIALGAVGILVFLLSATMSGGGTPAWAIREVAMAAASVGFPVILLGIVILLPGDRRMTYASLAGLAVCLVAVGLFVATYPMNWNVARTPDYSAQGVAIYAVGLVAAVGATGAALVGHQVERAAPGERAAEVRSTTGEAGTGTGGASDGASESVSDEQVRRDIDEAMADADLSWGGVSRKNTKRLELNTDADVEVDREAFENAEATTVRSSGNDVDDALSNLRKLQGREQETDSSSGVDDQTAALTELRQQQQAEDVATEDEEGIVDRAKGLFSR